MANMFARPNQLEKRHQLTRRMSRKKASMEARLKTAKQGLLNGVGTALGQLEKALLDTSDIRGCMADLEKKEENLRHSQLSAAKESWKHIFTVHEAVDRRGRTAAGSTESGRIGKP